MYAMLCILISIGTFKIVRIQDYIENIKQINIHPWILIIFAITLLAIGIFYFKIHESKFFISIKNFLILIGIKKKLDKKTLNKIIDAAGYSYQAYQDMFYSNIDAWQRNLGYTRLYDEAAAPLGMIVDCEPIYFEYNGKQWLIEFWKGQYDLTTGCEIGIYTTKGPDLDIPGYYKGTFYHSADDSELLQMSFSLIKNDRIILKRVAKHWWLTGFKLGEFSEPWELSMIISITFKDVLMRDEFIKGLINAGYFRHEIIIARNTVGLKFDKPRTQQPGTRTEKTDWLIQKKNELLCSEYQEITKPYDTLLDKFNAILKEAPELYKEIFNIGKTKKLYKLFNKIKKT